MSAEKRKRSTNFCVDEKVKLLRILQEKGHVIIENDNLRDSESMRIKDAAWIEIANDLNAISVIHRTPQKLKALWRKMRTDAKSYASLAEKRARSMQSARGSIQRASSDPTLELVAEMIGANKSENTIYCTPDLPVKRSLSMEEEDEKDLIYSTPTMPAPAEQYEAQVNYSDLKEDTPIIEENTPEFKLQPTSLKLKYLELSRQLTKEKISIIKLQQQYMATEHIARVKKDEIKTKIYEALLKKLEDNQPVNQGLINVVLGD